MYKKQSTLSFSTTVFIFSTYGLDPWRQYRTGISIVHILVRSMCVTTAFLLGRLTINYDARTSAALRQASNCEHVFTLMSVGKHRHKTKRWS